MENKAKPTQIKTPIASGNATRGKTTRSDFAGEANPHYILYVDYYLNMLELMMAMLLMLFGSQRLLLLTKEDPLQDGYLKPSNDFL